jgi:hypothetical protein
VAGATASVHAAPVSPLAVQWLGTHSFLSTHDCVLVPAYAAPQAQWYVIDGAGSSTHALPCAVWQLAVAVVVHALKSTHLGFGPPVDTQPLLQEHDHELPMLGVHAPPAPHGFEPTWHGFWMTRS